MDEYLKEAREDIYKHEKTMNEYDTKRDVDIEKNYINELKNIEKFIYDEFKRIINTLKKTEENFKNENNRLLNEANIIKREKNQIQNTIKELSDRLLNIKSRVGSSNNESEIYNDY